MKSSSKTSRNSNTAESSCRRNKIIGEFRLDKINPALTKIVISTFSKLQEVAQIVLCSYSKSNTYQIFALSYNYIVRFEEKNPEDYDFSCFVHLMDISKILIGGNEIQIASGDGKIIINGIMKYFPQLIYQNISRIHFMTKQCLRPEIIISENFILNNFEPKLSPSQIFQLNYSSYQKHTNNKYHHSIVQTFHQTLSANYPLFDINRLPLSAVDSLAISLSSIMTFDNICGFICTDTLFSHAFQAISNTLLIAKENLRIVHLTNVAATSDNFDQFNSSFIENIPENLIYLDLSESVLESLDTFAENLAKSKSNLKHIGFSHCNITVDGCELFFKILSENEMMKNLKVLKIGSFVFNPQSIKFFSNYLAGNANIETIDLSGIDKYLADILLLLNKTKQPLKHLWLRHTNISGNVHENLIELLENSDSIEELDLGLSQISDNDLADIIKVFGTKCKGNLKIGLSELVVTETQSMAIVRGFLETNFDKWSEIDMDGCMMDQNVVKVILALFGRMNNLEVVSISNFRGASLSFASGLLQQPSIKRLNLSASLDDLTDELHDSLLNTTAEFIDISYNCWSNDSLSIILNIYRHNTNLRSIKICGNAINDIDLLKQFVDEAINRESCTECLFGGNTVFDPLDNNKVHSLFLKMSTAVDYHRAKQGLLMELPNGVLIDDLRELTEKSVSILKGLELHKHLVMPHTFLPLPFQDASDVPSDSKNEEEFIVTEKYPSKSSQEIALGKSDTETIIVNKPPFVPICIKPKPIDLPKDVNEGDKGSEEDEEDENVDSGFVLESIKQKPKLSSDSYSEDSDILNTKALPPLSEDFFANIENYSAPNNQTIGEPKAVTSPRSSPLVIPQQSPNFIGDQLEEPLEFEETGHQRSPNYARRKPRVPQLSYVSDSESDSEISQGEVLGTVDSILKSQFVDLSSMDVPSLLEYSNSSDDGFVRTEEEVPMPDPPGINTDELYDLTKDVSKSSLASDISLKRSRVPMKVNSTLRTPTRGLPSENTEKATPKASDVKKKKAFTPRAPKLGGTSLLARRKISPNMSAKKTQSTKKKISGIPKAKSPSNKAFDTPTKKTPSKIPRKLFQASGKPTKNRRRPSVD